MASTGAEGLEGEPVGLSSGLFDARRFRGFGVGGGRVEKVVLVAVGCEGPSASTGAIGAATAAGEVVEADTFWRFCDGGDLSRVSVSRVPRPLVADEAELDRGLTPYWPGLLSDFAPGSNMYCHPQTQTPIMVSISREYPSGYGHANWCSKWSEPVTHELLARRGWSGAVTPRNQNSRQIQRDKREGREHVVIGSWNRGRRGQRVGNLTGFQMSRLLLRHGEQATTNPVSGRSGGHAPSRQAV